MISDPMRLDDIVTSRHLPRLCPVCAIVFMRCKIGIDGARTGMGS